MGTIHPFRRLRWGEPRKLPTPHFLRRRRWRLGGLANYTGFIAVAALIGAAAFLPGPWRDGGTPRLFGRMGITVIDGDTLRAGSERIRLIGIDAPELHQNCRDADGREWACGREAKMRLYTLISIGEVACSARGRDYYGRTLAVCSANDVTDVGEALVRDGLAINSGRYYIAEWTARAAGRGIWGGVFQSPRDWRRQHQRRAAR